MYSIREESRKFIRFQGDKSVERMSIDCDTAADLPAVDAIPKIIIGQGSIAWDISTGDIYGMQTNGTWKKQLGDV